MPSILTSSPFLVVAGVVILILLIAFVASRYHVAGANEALIVAGAIVVVVLGLWDDIKRIKPSLKIAGPPP